MHLSNQQVKFLQQGSLTVGVLLIIFCFFFTNGYIDFGQNIKFDVTYSGKAKIKDAGTTVLKDFDCDEITSARQASSKQECKILAATHGLAITSIVLGTTALVLIILRSSILKQVYKAHKQIGFIIILILIFVPLLFTIMMPVWKVVNTTSFISYTFFPVLLELLSFGAYAIAFGIELYLGVNKKTTEVLLD